MNDKKLYSEVPSAGNGPNVQSSNGGITPSGWGSSSDGKRVQVGQNSPEASSPNARGAGDVRHDSYPQSEAAENPAEQASSHRHGDQSFRCADAMEAGCGWSVTGNNEEEILGYMRVHAREAHGKNEFTPKELANARRAIHKRAA